MRNSFFTLSKGNAWYSVDMVYIVTSDRPKIMLLATALPVPKQADSVIITVQPITAPRALTPWDTLLNISSPVVYLLISVNIVYLSVAIL